MSARASSSVSARATVAMKRERLISISWVISVPARSVRISFTESVSPLRLLVVPLMMLPLYRVGTQQRRMVVLVNYDNYEGSGGHKCGQSPTKREESHAPGVLEFLGCRYASEITAKLESAAGILSAGMAQLLPVVMSTNVERGAVGPWQFPNAR